MNNHIGLRELKESFRMMKAQEDKKVVLINLTKYKTMLSYCKKKKKKKY